MLKDKEIRERLFDFLEVRYGKTRIIEEKNIGKSRADVVMVLPDKIVGIEIKSDADTYTRLAGQIPDYDLFFDQNIIVVGSTHATHVGEHVPDYWGIISVEEMDGDEIDFYVIREMTKNPNMNPKKKIQLLWRPELAHIQELNNMPVYKQKSKDFVQDKILERIPEPILQEQISQELFERDYTAIWEEIQQYRQNVLGKKRRRRRSVKKGVRKARKSHIEK